MKSYLFIYEGRHPVTKNDVYIFHIMHIPQSKEEGAPLQNASNDYRDIEHPTLKGFRSYVRRYEQLGYDIRITTKDHAVGFFEQANKKYLTLIG